MTAADFDAAVEDLRTSSFELESGELDVGGGASPGLQRDPPSGGELARRTRRRGNEEMNMRWKEGVASPSVRAMTWEKNTIPSFTFGA